VSANEFALVACYTEEDKSKHTKIFGPGYHTLGRYYEVLETCNLSNMNSSNNSNVKKSPLGDITVCIAD